VKHKQILKARNTKMNKLQPKKACRIELADLEFPLIKSILPPALLDAFMCMYIYTYINIYICIRAQGWRVRAYAYAQTHTHTHIR